MKKKIVLLGDSIRKIGYGPVVKQRLEPEFDVWDMEDNGRYTQHTLRYFRDYCNELQGTDLFHWNNGLWDQGDFFGDGPFTPLDHYVENMLRILRMMKTFTPKIIFATTTPVHPDFPYHRLERTKLYNDTIVPLLQKEGVIINDLFSVMLPHRIDGIRDDLVHLNDLGIRLCADQTERIIRETLNS